MVRKAKINPGFRPNEANKKRLAFLDTLSPTRREEVSRAIKFTDNDALDDLLRHLDADPNDPEDVVVKVLLSDSLRDAMMHQAAGKGYRKQGIEASTRGQNKGKYLLIPDKPTDYGPEEQAALEILALRKELDYIEGAPVNPIDPANPLYQRIARHTAASIRPTSVIAMGEGGIIGNRGKHPALPPQTLENATVATNNQLFDNLVGNERGEQPITNIDRHGNRSGLPVEHKKPFEDYPELGRDPNNRMLGSTSKNSVLRNEERPARQMALLMSNLAEGETNFKSKFGRTIRDYMADTGMQYKPGQPVMPDYGLVE